LFIIASLFVVAVFVVYELVHTMVLAKLHHTLCDVANTRGYLCVPMVPVAVAKVDLCVLVHVAQLLYEL
jgi:hypothetical protein